MESRELIRAVCEDIYNIARLKTVLYDADGRWLLSYPQTMCGFCTQIRKQKGLLEQCLNCDRTGFARSRKSGEICIYRCHMGLTEVVAPIIDDGMVIGYLMFGQVLSAGDRQNVQEKILQTKPLAEKQVLFQLLEEMEEKSDTQIRAAARIISMCACYIRLHRLLKEQRDPLALRISRYIQTHIADPALGMQGICREFAISRGTLYNLSKKNFGMGICEYIRHVRLKKAKELLETADMPVCCVAEACGFLDVNYFIKLMKKVEGKTPGQIRKNARLDKENF